MLWPVYSWGYSSERGSSLREKKNASLGLSWCLNKNMKHWQVRKVSGFEETVSTTNFTTPECTPLGEWNCKHSLGYGDCVFSQLPDTNQLVLCHGVSLLLLRRALFHLLLWFRLLVGILFLALLLTVSVAVSSRRSRSFCLTQQKNAVGAEISSQIEIHLHLEPAFAHKHTHTPIQGGYETCPRSSAAYDNVCLFQLGTSISLMFSAPLALFFHFSLSPPSPATCSHSFFLSQYPAISL